MKIVRSSAVSDFEDFFHKEKVEPKREKDTIMFSFYKDHCEHSVKSNLKDVHGFW